MQVKSRIKKISKVKASEILPNPKNWRTHPEEQKNAMMGAFAEIGNIDVLKVFETPKGLMLVDGHLRTDILGDNEVEVAILDLTQEEADKALLTFDPIAIAAAADEKKLAELMDAIDLESKALAGILENIEIPESKGTGEVVEVEPQISKADELKEKWGTAEGQLWLIEGNQEHRLLCGDSTSAEDVGRLMGGERAESMVTDPPYGIGIAANPVRQKHKKSEWDAKPIEPAGFLSMVQSSIIWGGNYFKLPPAKGFFVWDKKQPENFTLAMCEMAWTNIDSTAKMFRQSVTSYQKEHPTQKPVDLIAWCIGYVSGAILDPFLGSGTTMLAAEQLNRKCYGMEISPAYTAVILQRMTDAGCKCKLSE